jgi:hypothetical protein
LLPVLATVFGSELSMMTIIFHTRSVLAPTWRPDRLSASQRQLSVINRLISGFHDCKWYCESLSVIKSGLTGLPVGHAHELVHPRRPARDQGVLELLDLACVKINKPKPRRLSLIMCRVQSTNVSVTGIHSSAPSRFSDVPGVAAAGLIRSVNEGRL